MNWKVLTEDMTSVLGPESGVSQTCRTGGGGGLQEERRASSHPEGPRALVVKGAAGYHVRLLREVEAKDADIIGQRQ